MNVPLTGPEIASWSVGLGKIVDYLLNPTHPVGGSKAAWFYRCGFSADQPRVLMDALIQHAQRDDGERSFVEDSDFGATMIVTAHLETPRGVSHRPVRSVWALDGTEAVLVTAYPIRKRRPASSGGGAADP